MTAPAATSPAQPGSDVAAWKAVVLQFQKPSRARAIWQLVNTLGPYVGLWMLMHASLQWSAWITLALATVAGLFLVRIFIIFHDCGHGSFFKSPRANAVVGFITGMLTLTPYYHWRWEHSVHHATAGALDRRGKGDVWTMTVEEYLRSSRWKRFAYRLARNPFVLFGLAPVYLFMIAQRIPASGANPRERASVHWMNFAVATMAAALIWIYGFLPWLLIQLTITMVGGGVGVWMFYVQHQFEDVYWERDENWDFTLAALKGSSFYKLPKILQWFSGNIGFHHIHHLSSRIPNYNLERCHKADPMFHEVPALTLLSSLKSLTFRLWDEQRGRLVGFRHVRKMPRVPRDSQPQRESPEK